MEIELYGVMVMVEKSEKFNMELKVSFYMLIWKSAKYVFQIPV